MNVATKNTRYKNTPRPQYDALFAALDLGTNNCRLLIASDDRHKHAGGNSGIRVVDSFSRIVRLGEGVSVTGELSDEAMQRTFAALAVCKKKLNRFQLKDARLIATEACRKAKNTNRFLQEVKDKLEMNIEVISNEEEARLAFLGCSSLLEADAKRAIVFDIGGGSTELMWIDVDKAMKYGETRANTREDQQAYADILTDWLSVDSGVMNLADRFGGSNFADVAYDDMVTYITERIMPFNQKNNITSAMESTKVQMLSTSGTVTTLAAIHLNLLKYDRTRVDGLKIGISHLRKTIEMLKAMRPSERFNHPCIGHERADFILSGCAVFDAISRVWPTMDITIADRGVREGIILSLMRQHG